MPLLIPKLCFATNNPGKINEVRALLKNSIEVLSLGDIKCYDELPETHDTLEGNATEKALYVYQKYKINCFADDSGLEVDFLNGAPGVYSARYAGTHGNSVANMDLLLKNLLNTEEREARFKTVISLVTDGNISIFEGCAEGHIIKEKRGVNGFGYDPVFVPSGYEKTFAELHPEEKNQVSHRAKAVKKLIEFLVSSNIVI